MKADRPHPGITMHQIPVGGGFIGLLFTIGSMAIFLIAIPALWVTLIGAIVFGIGFVLVLRRVHR